MQPSPTTADRPRPLVCLIAAIARNGAIGAGNGLVWKESADQKRFKQLTMGAPVVMGRKTWDSLPARFRPLPGRRNIVVTANRNWRAAGAEAVDSLDAALALAAGAPRVFVIGGAQTYAAALPLADELELTEVDADMEGDAFFPAWRATDFELVTADAHVSAAGIAYRFATYRRRLLHDR